jgi:hypothetical protein
MPAVNNNQYGRNSSRTLPLDALRRRARECRHTAEPTNELVLDGFNRSIGNRTAVVIACRQQYLNEIALVVGW